jgi:hypothetical protein
MEDIPEIPEMPDFEGVIAIDKAISDRFASLSDEKKIPLLLKVATHVQRMSHFSTLLLTLDEEFKRIREEQQELLKLLGISTSTN